LVACSRKVRRSIALQSLLPHISRLGERETQTAGRSAIPKRAQRFSSVNCTQRTPASFPPGIPGMGEEMEGAMQQAAQPIRQFMAGLPDACGFANGSFQIA
jgi:hypothetical protein